MRWIAQTYFRKNRWVAGLRFTHWRAVSHELTNYSFLKYIANQIFSWSSIQTLSFMLRNLNVHFEIIPSSMLKSSLYKKLTVSVVLNINLGLGPVMCNETTPSIICGLCQKACGWMGQTETASVFLISARLHKPCRNSWVNITLFKSILHTLMDIHEEKLIGLM